MITISFWFPAIFIFLGVISIKLFTAQRNWKWNKQIFNLQNNYILFIILFDLFWNDYYCFEDCFLYFPLLHSSSQMQILLTLHYYCLNCFPPFLAPLPRVSQFVSSDKRDVQSKCRSSKRRQRQWQCRQCHLLAEEKNIVKMFVN